MKLIMTIIIRDDDDDDDNFVQFITYYMLTEHPIIQFPRKHEW
jgi:hypothetical protein